MRTDLFDFELPEDRIALHPASPRDAARLLVVRPGDAAWTTASCATCRSCLRPGDALVFNDTRVIPAALEGVRRRGELEAQISVTLHRAARSEPLAGARAAGQAPRGGRPHALRPRRQACASLGALDATVAEQRRGGRGDARLRSRRRRSRRGDRQRWATCRCRPTSPAGARRTMRDRRDYQTIYAAHEGAVAAPTAGLHFTPALMAALDARGIARHFVTLHVGAGTFLPVKADDTGATTRCTRSGARSPRETAAALNAVRARRRADRRGRHHVAAAARERGGRRATIAAFPRRDRHLHHAGLSLPRRRPADDQLPSAALDAVHAGRGVLPGSTRCSAAYAHAHRAAATASIPTATPACCSSRAQRLGHDGAQAFVRLQALARTAPGRRARALRRDHDAARRSIRTPAFMPVGTGGDRQGAVPRPGARRRRRHRARQHLSPDAAARRRAHRAARRPARFMRWDGPILTDSGGFQVMSLGEAAQDRRGGRRLPVAHRRLAPRCSRPSAPSRSSACSAPTSRCSSTNASSCRPSGTGREARDGAVAALGGARAQRAFARQAKPGQALFGIVQGGMDAELRRRSAEALVGDGFSGLRGRRPRGRRGPRADAGDARR